MVLHYLAGLEGADIICKIAEKSAVAKYIRLFFFQIPRRRKYYINLEQLPLPAQASLCGK